ncbi:4Fe-4S binding protein [Pseudozobellia thermophila]|uniref:Pyruvate-ferredoxin/flavodoxin oxidoreductase n=1 Tax=Pseudozobellia thermophila TaxID=192903 RepID=A0A1M6LPU0_9FLAO|nr:4Fe-4S binding protein [Pseudozobellia thermophila]SHJ73217.1 pyruvate-ferredoxin/flavodoxin oxidoreductase [Pseudozobellia thermophila]
MNTKSYIVATANQATAQIAYKTNEVCAIYPITPSSEMSELAEEWSAENQNNIYGGVPSVFEMQSEAGVAGVLHGALQTGSLATTFTASQGLLLMIPNMYKIAGELTPNVIHVATRSIATHALSVFGDHSDIMAARSTGYAFLGGASVQEAMDFALISQAATLESRIPFVHFFDGFRTSHETAKIEGISDAVITEMMDMELIQAHRRRGLNPNNPVLRGTSQGPDVFFQGREAVNSFYDACPSIVQNQMDKFAELTGRQYKLFDYVGHPEAEQVIIAMASATETIEETFKYLNVQGEKVGLIKVRLFRPFSTEHLIEALPKSCKSIAVLDRTKEPGSTGEPLYLDIVQSLMSVTDTYATLPKIVGGRYGLSSKEFNPNMVKAVYENLKSEKPKNNFTIGTNDDKTNLSLPYANDLQLQDDNLQVLFYETKSEATCASFEAVLQIVGNAKHVQGYTEIDYKKSGSRSVSNLRISEQPIKAPYLISNADVVGCDLVNFLENDNVLERTKINGAILVNTTLNTIDFWKSLSYATQKEIQQKNVSLYVVNSCVINKSYQVSDTVLSRFHSCVLALAKDLNVDKNNMFFEEFITKVDTSIVEVSKEFPIEMDTEFLNSLLGKMMANGGDELPVSAIPVDGTYATDTAKFNIRNTGNFLPDWDADLCTQCGACSMACPQGAIRIKAYDDTYLLNAPESFKSVKSIEQDWKIDLLNYTVQVNPEQCTSCNNCIDACPAKALVMKSKAAKIEKAKENWNHFDRIPEFDRTKIDTSKVSQQQLQEPLFKYSIGVDGCGEAPYLKLMSQLFGDRMLVANATGASSIFGGALPSTPWAKNSEGRGPAWSNSLFEDNAEFGLGYRLSLDQQEQQAKSLLKKLLPELDFDLACDILTAEQNTEKQIQEQRKRVKKLKAHLTTVTKVEAQQLIQVADSLVKQSVWIVGGDGWAYDIGYGGLDHAIASGKNVNILVLDNEVYSNTGGQMSKATPFGAMAKFASNGRQKQKKDLGRLMMTYDDVYVASVAISANQEQILKAFQEAESYDGPSLIIAYCHSPAHGIDMKNPSRYHKAAVASGQWMLYRNDPRRMDEGLNPLQLDSDAPSIPIEDYLRMEERFERLFETDKEAFSGTMSEVQKQVDKRYRKYVDIGNT